MSDEHRGKIFKNTVELTGNKDFVDDAINALKNEEGYADFNCIVPIETDAEDIHMNDYINACLNVWLNKHEEVNRDEFISTMSFVGITREYVYKFKELSIDEINIYKTKYSVSNMLKDADNFINSVKKKSIFNGYFARESSWGTGTQPINSKIKGNRIEFITFHTPALKAFEKLSIKFPDIRITYTYVYEYKDENNKTKSEINVVTFKNAECRILRQDSREAVNTFKIIKENVAM